MIVSVGRINGTGVDAAGVDLKGWSTSPRCRLRRYGRKSHREPFALSPRNPQVPEVPVWGGWVRGSVGIYIERLTEKPGVQELCESRGGRPGLSVLTSLLVSVDVRHWSQLVPNMSTDI